MKVVLISPPTPNPATSYFGPPMGLALLGALLKERGHGVRGYDWDRSTLEAMIEDVPRMLAEDAPGLVGISILSITRGPGFTLARKIRELAPELPIVIGGPYATLAPEEMLQRAPANFVCVGDGEETLPELVEVLVAGGDPAAVSGLALRRDGQIIRTLPRADFTDLDSLPYPDLDMFDVAGNLAKYQNPAAKARHADLRSKGRTPYVPYAALMVLGSRGCVWRCDFCPMSKFNGRTRMHSPAYIAEYMEFLVKRYNHREMVFGDNTLTWWREHSVELFNRLIEKNLGLEWICMTRADMVDPELLALMHGAGCREISYGIESGSEVVHRTIKKKLRLHKVKDAFAEVHAAGINSTCMLMVGNRGETRETLRHTTGLLREVDPDRILIWTTKVYPGTVLHDAAVEQGVIGPNYYDDDFAPAPYYTGEHNAAELAELEGMLLHRSVWVDAGEETSAARIDRDFRMSNWRASGGTVIGGPGVEPLARTDIFELFAAAKTHDTKFVILETSAAPLVDRKFCERVHLANAVRELVVPLWSMNDRHHDVRVGKPGALLATRKGLLRWTTQPMQVRALLMLDRFDVHQIRPWIRWLKEHRVTEAVLVFGETMAGWQKVPTADLPTLAEASAAVVAAADEARSLGLRFSASGLPRCLVPTEVEIFEQSRPFDESVTAEGEPFNLALSQRESRKQFAPACEGCALRNQCEGLWVDVVLAQGTSGLRPLHLPDPALVATG